MLTFYEQGSLPSSSTQPAPAAHGVAQAPVTVPALVVACKFPAPAGGGSRVFVLVLHSGHLHVAGAGPSCGEPGRPVRLVQTDMAASHVLSSYGAQERAPFHFQPAVVSR